MASVDEIAQLRLLVAEPTDATYSDEQLSNIIDAAGSLNGAAADVWTQKAAASATLVNVSESGSSRSLGDLSRNALSMAKTFRDQADSETPGTSGGISIKRITRR